MSPKTLGLCPVFVENLIPDSPAFVQPGSVLMAHQHVMQVIVWRWLIYALDPVVRFFGSRWEFKSVGAAKCSVTCVFTLRQLPAWSCLERAEKLHHLGRPTHRCHIHTFHACD